MHPWALFSLQMLRIIPPLEFITRIIDNPQYLEVYLSRGQLEDTVFSIITILSVVFMLFSFNAIRRKIIFMRIFSISVFSLAGIFSTIRIFSYFVYDSLWLGYERPAYFFQLTAVQMYSRGIIPLSIPALILNIAVYGVCAYLIWRLSKRRRSPLF